MTDRRDWRRLPPPRSAWCWSTIQAFSPGFCLGLRHRLPHSCHPTGSTMRGFVAPACWHAMSAVIAPLKDAVRLSLANQHRELLPDGVRAIGGVALSLMGGGDPCAVRKRQSADRSGVFTDYSPDPWSVTWRTLFAFGVAITIGATLWPSPPRRGRRVSMIARSIRYLSRACPTPQASVRSTALGTLPKFPR